MFHDFYWHSSFALDISVPQFLENTIMCTIIEWRSIKIMKHLTVMCTIIKCKIHTFLKNWRKISSMNSLQHYSSRTLASNELLPNVLIILLKTDSKFSLTCCAFSTLIWVCFIEFILYTVLELFFFCHKWIFALKAKSLLWKHYLQSAEVCSPYCGSLIIWYTSRNVCKTAEYFLHQQWYQVLQPHIKKKVEHH